MNQESLPHMNLSNYRILSKIGAGGMGEVYRARDTRLNREVAIKVCSGSGKLDRWLRQDDTIEMDP